MNTNVTTKHLASWAAVAALWISASPVSAGQFGLFTYRLIGETVEITDYPEDEVGEVAIPAEIDGRPVTHIGSEAFAGCSLLTSITIPEGVTEIAGGSWNSGRVMPTAFSGCSSLTSITIPESVVSIGSGVFSGCSELISILVKPGNPHYASDEGVLFDTATAMLLRCPDGKSGSYTIPGGTTLIHWRAFRSSDGLTSVTIPASVSDMGVVPFLGSIGLTSIQVEPGNLHYASHEGVLYDADMTWLVAMPEAKSGDYVIPEGVESVGWGYGFWNCRALTSITIPSTLTDMGEWSPIDLFDGCSALTAIFVAPGNPVYTSDDGVLYGSAGLVRCPPAKQGHYTVQEGVTSLGYEAFADCTQLTSVTLPASVGNLGVSTFYGCSRLESVFFLGSGPFLWAGSMVDGADVVTFYCFDEAEGFGSSFLERPVVRMGPGSPVAKSNLRQGLPYDFVPLPETNNPANVTLRSRLSKQARMLKRSIQEARRKGEIRKRRRLAHRLKRVQKQLRAL